MGMFYYKPSDKVCTTEIGIAIEGKILADVKFVKGCDGNLSSIRALITGMPVLEVIKKLEYITCGTKQTSCSAELVKGIKVAINQDI